MPLAKLSILALLVFFTSLSAQALDSPETNPSEVRVNGRKLGHSWRDGRVFVSSSEIQSLSGNRPETVEADLLKALETLDQYTWTFQDNILDIKRKLPTPRYFHEDAARNHNDTMIQRHNARSQEFQTPDLVFSAHGVGMLPEFFDVDVMVQNQGNAESEFSVAICWFEDAQGRLIQQFEHRVPALEPEVKFLLPTMSLSRQLVGPKPPRPDRVFVYFISLEKDEARPASIRQARKRANQRRRGRL